MSEIEQEPTRRMGEGIAHATVSPIPEYLLTWDRYTLKRRLGSGGMGEVFEAWDPRLGRSVALKLLAGTEPDTLARFEREARAQARVDHPAICKVFEVGEVAGRRYIAMQQIHGVTLDQVAPALTLEQKLELVREIAEAVHAAHRRGLIHRDLKPANILVERDENGSYRPFIVDFGLARDQRSPGATIDGTIAGTLGYMSPEQALGRIEDVDRRTDVYNLGIILYELVADHPAFEINGLLDSLVRMQTIEIASPRRFKRNIPVDVETIVMKALERQPARRYHSAHAMAEDLRRFLDGEPIVARRSSLLYRVRTRIRKHRLIASIVAAALLLLVIAGGLAMRERWRADARAELAQQFGMEIKELDLLTRVAGMLPPERAVPVRTIVLPRMQRIREQMRRSGKPAEGPGAYALARGRIALGDHRGAWTLLEQARRAHYDTPDVHYARAQVLGHFYEEALARAAGPGEAELRIAARAEATRRYRGQVIEELRLAENATTAPPELLRAQLALREERLEDAIAAARTVTASSPWLYDAVMIEVAALGTRARTLNETGKFDEGLAGYDAARARLQSALAIARGDPVVHYEDCRLQNQILSTVRFQRRLTAADATRASAPCIVATHLDPMMSAPWMTRGMIHTVIAEDALRHGEDPTSQINAAVAAMQKAIALDRADAAALHGLGRTQLILARWGVPHGVDPRPRLDAAIASVEKAVAMEPRSSGYRLTLANTFLTRGEYEYRVGNDSRPWLMKAIEQGRRALEPDANLFLVHNLLGNTYNTLADRELTRGGDPRPAIAQAAKAFARAIALNPSNSSVYNNQGNTFLTLAEYLGGRGEAIDDAAAKAIASYRRAIEIRPDYTLVWINIGTTNRILAADRVRHGQDPMPLVRAAHDALDRYLAANPGDVDAEIERARLANIEAEWRVARGENPSAAVAAAQKAARYVLSVDKDSVAAAKALEESRKFLPSSH